MTPRPDRITLTGVRAFGRHGVLAAEREEGQDFLVDVVLHVDTRPAAEHDDLSATVSYAEVAQEVVDVVGGEPVDLLETLAARLARRLLAHEVVQAVDVTVHKPAAPIPVPFADVTVAVHRRRDTPVVIALGANLGEPAHTLAAAVRDLRRRGLRAARRSALLRTTPVGGPPGQPDYLNAVLTARTSLPPRALLDLLHAVEDRHGRTREQRWGPRTLDLDLVAYGRPGEPDQVTGPQPALPHPRAHERVFVLAPWLELEPDAVLPTPTGDVRVADLLAGLDPAGTAPGPPWPSRHRAGA